MNFFERLKDAAAIAGNVASQAADMAMEQTAGIRGKAAALAGSAFTEVRDAASRALNKTDRFSPVDIDQAAEAMTLSGLGLRAEDGSWRAPSPEEMHGLAEVVLAATLADDGDDGDDENAAKVLDSSDA